MIKFTSSKLLLMIVGISLSTSAFSHGGGGGHGGGSNHGGGGAGQSQASSSHEANNHSNQLNPNNDAYWQSRGYSETPDDWEARSTSTYDDNHANQLNPNNQEYLQSRGVTLDNADLSSNTSVKVTSGTHVKTHDVELIKSAKNLSFTSLTWPLIKIGIGTLGLYLLFKKKSVIKLCNVCRTKNRVKSHSQNLKPICSHCKSEL